MGGGQVLHTELMFSLHLHKINIDYWNACICPIWVDISTKAWLMDTEQPALHIAFHSLCNSKNGKTIIYNWSVWNMTVYHSCSSNQQYTCNKLLSAYCVTLAINMYQPLFQCMVQIKKAYITWRVDCSRFLSYFSLRQSDSTEPNSIICTKRVKRKITLQLLLTQGVERRWSQVQTWCTNDRFPHRPEIQAIFQVIFCWACIDSAFGSSRLVKHFNSSSASCKKIPQSSPSCSSISTWSLIKLGLLFVRGNFRPNSLVVEDNTFSKYVPEKFVSKWVQPPTVSEWRPLMSSSSRTIQKKWMALGDLIARQETPSIRVNQYPVGESLKY